MGKSLMETLAAMPEDERAAILEGVDMDALMWDWSAWARPEQRPPDSVDWAVWLYLAGRGCISGDTRIYNPKTGRHVPAKDLVGVPTWVQTPYGSQFVEEGTYVKGVDQLWRVKLSNGSEVVVTAGHKFLTSQGWQRLASIHVGQLLAVDALAHRETRAYCSSTCASSALHYSETVSDFQCDCLTYRRSHGQRLLPVSDTDQDVLPLRDDAVARSSTEYGTDVLGYEQECTPHGLLDILLAKTDSFPDEPLLAVWGFRGTSLHGEQIQDLFHTYSRSLESYTLHQTAQRVEYLHNPGVPSTSVLWTQSFSSLEGPHPQQQDGFLPFLNIHRQHLQFQSELRHRYTSQLLVQDPNDSAFRRSSDADEELSREHPAARRSVELAFLQDIDDEQSLDHILSGSFDPLLQWAHIESIEPAGVDVFYDITVPLFSCYYAEGVLHHNSGKTRSAAEWVREKAKVTNQGILRFALVARTAADVRDVLVEGESGIINVSPPSEKPHYEPSKRRLTWPNGNTATLFTADEPDSLRGIQAHYAWADELAAWRQTPDAAGMTSWDNLRVATRLGSHPQIIATTTPKRVPILYSLLEEAKQTGKVVISKGSTMDNAGNLSETYISTILGVYQGTRLAQQELYGEMLDDVEGALWTIEMIEAARQGLLPPSAPLRCVGVDPSVAENPRDECGIIVCASTADRDMYKRHAWVLEDATVHGSPEVWATKVVETARRWQAPVIAEVNQGGALVKNAINSIDPSITVLEVHSKYGKALRAEPVVLAYEQARVHHVGYLTDLESQMTAWIPGETRNSPDRVDALVHAMTALMIKPPPGFMGGKLTAKSPASRRIPSTRGSSLTSRGGKVYLPRPR